MLSWYQLLTLLALCMVSESAILRAYPIVPDLYVNLRNSYPGFHESDPFSFLGSRERAEACKELLESRTYSIVADSSQIPFLAPRDPRNSNANNFQTQPGANPEHVEYNELTVSLQGNEETIRGFLCLHLPYITWYLTYGFNPDFKFVLETTESEPQLHISSLLEPTPSIDRTLFGLENQQNLEKKFLSDLIRKVNEPGAVNGPHKICLLNANQQFHVCTAVFDAWHEIEYGSGVRDHYVRLKENQCTQHTIQLEKNYKDELNLNMAGVKSHLLPCAVDREWSTSNFYLTADPLDAYSVYMVTYQGSPNGSGDAFRFHAHIQNISFLKYRVGQ